MSTTVYKRQGLKLPSVPCGRTPRIGYELRTHPVHERVWNFVFVSHTLTTTLEATGVEPHLTPAFSRGRSKRGRRLERFVRFHLAFANRNKRPANTAPATS
jgi:hypothetical protein